MSVFAVSNGIGLAADTAFGVGTSIQRIVQGHKNRVRFVRGANTLVEFDLVISQSHSQETAPSAFPIEANGQTICDYILVPPPEVQLTGLVSDNPLGDTDSLQRAAITTAAGLVGPAGVAAQGIGAYLSQRSQKGSVRRSLGVLNTLRVLAGGQALATDYGQDAIKPPNVSKDAGPGPFTVVFPNFSVYNSMVIKSLECQIDSSTGDALVFTVALTQVRVVQTQTTLYVSTPQAAAMANKGVKDAAEKAEQDSIVKTLKRGVYLGSHEEFVQAAKEF